jgi:uncharacterized UPF0160 family protein
MNHINYLVTHSGIFHADDVCAAAILRVIYPDAGVIRTRDASKIKGFSEQKSITFDVGDVYDPKERRFDHHMKGAATREDGTVYSSLGLIWKEYGLDYLNAINIPAEFREAVFEAMDKDFVLPIDMIDNGHLSPGEIGVTSGVSMPVMIDEWNPADPAMSNSHFIIVSGMMSAFIKMKAHKFLEHELNHEIIVEAVKFQEESPILELPRSIDFQPILDDIDADHVLFVVQPSSSGGYGLTCARESAGGYVNRLDLPESWGGLTGIDLQIETGVPDVTFCHTGLFFAAGDTIKSMRKLAKLALPEDPAPTP